MRVKKAEYIKDCKIKILFSDGITKVVDFKVFFNDKRSFFLPLHDMEYFKKFIVDDTTICWPNQLDFCPDVLYEKGVKTKKTKPVLSPTPRKTSSLSKNRASTSRPSKPR